MVSKAVLFAPAAAYRCRHAPGRWSDPLSARIALLPVGNKPLVEHALDDLVEAGIAEVVVVTAPHVAEEVQALLSQMRPDRLAVGKVLTHTGTFLGALRQVAGFIGADPFLVHLGDSLTRVGLAPAIAGSRLARNDVTALIDETADVATPLAPGLANLPTLGVYVFGAGLLEVAAESGGRGDWDGQIAGVTERLAAAGGTVDVRPVRECWRFRERPDAVLLANRFFLSSIRGEASGASLIDSDLQGPVDVHPTARLTSTTVRGPVVIGAGAEIRDAYVGPYTSVGSDVLIENAEVEHSVILAAASIRHLGGRLEASVVGPRARIYRDFRLPRAVRVNIGEDAEIAIA
jgi:glucose-1-phosphate thymidylyltransferase